MQYQPNPSSCFKYAPHFGQGLMDMHIRQRNSRKNKIEMFTLEWKTFCSCTYEINSLVELSSQRKRGFIQVEPNNCRAGLEVSGKQCLACTTANIENSAVRL